MWTLDLGQIQQCCWTWVTWKGARTNGIGSEPKNMKALDFPTPEKII
jgi:hypothetical protein